MTSIPRFEYRIPPRVGNSVFAKEFNMTNAQAKGFEESDAFKHIVSSIRAKFQTFNSDMVPISRREMQRPMSNVFFAKYLKAFYPTGTDATGASYIDPNRDPPMTPLAYMAQQTVLKALQDYSGPWLQKERFEQLVDTPHFFQFAIAPKLEPTNLSKRVTTEDAYSRHIRGIFTRFAGQNKQDIFIEPYDYFMLPIDKFHIVMKRTGQYLKTRSQALSKIGD